MPTISKYRLRLLGTSRRACVGSLAAILLGVVSLFGSAAPAAEAGSLGAPAWGTNGIVDAVLPAGKLVYVGGLGGFNRSSQRWLVEMILRGPHCLVGFRRLGDPR